MLKCPQAWYPKAFYIFFILIQYTDSQLSRPFDAIVNFLQEYQNQNDNEPADQKNMFNEYDFIIVGAGTAGCVIANRLSEVPEWKILLIEAGSKENYLMDIPVFAAYLQATPANWKYKTEPSDKYCSALKNKQCNFPRGKVVGGSSVLNYMIYTTGTSYDYDNWRSKGNEDWGWDDISHYFRKIENYNIPGLDKEMYHGKEGNLNIEYSSFRSSKGMAWVEAAQNLGFQYVDYNGPSTSGVSFHQFSLKNGTRHSSSRAYLHPIKTRKNLHLTKLSFATKLLFNANNDRVLGVEIEKNGKKIKVLVKNEIIISAGAINSPQLLMLSGIGPKDHLSSLNIPVVQNLPVGFNLMDHAAAGGLHFLVEKQNFVLTSDNIFSRPDLFLEWMRTHTGPLSSPGGSEALIFLELKDKYNKTSWPDLELLFLTGGLNADSSLKFNLGIDDKIYSETFDSLGDSDSFMVFPIQLRPKSRGRIMLKTKNPKDHPSIIPNYFDHPEDLQKLVEGLKLAIQISKQPAMKNLKTKLYDVPIKKCLKYGPFGSDTYFECQVRMFTFTMYHQSGTCKMGPKSDSSSVVDPKLKVHGISNLRVIDASIMPEIVASHTNAPTYMIAEKGSDMIKEEWKKLTVKKPD